MGRHWADFSVQHFEISADVQKGYINTFDLIWFAKTELLLIGTKSILKVGTLIIDETTVSSSHQARKLDTILDSTLSFDHHIQQTVKSLLFNLCNIAKVRSPPVSTTLLSGFNLSSLYKLQMVQNSVFLKPLFRQVS